MFFASDNWAGAHSKIAERLLAESGGFASAYGTSDLDQTGRSQVRRDLRTRRRRLFRRDRHGRQLAVARQRPEAGRHQLLPPEAHVAEDECGAPDFFSGARLATVDGAAGKIDPKALATKVARFPQDAVHHGRPLR